MYVTHFRITVAAINNEGGIGENTTYIRATGIYMYMYTM